MTWLSQLFGMFRPLQWWIVIAPWESGLRVRLGKVASVLTPGFHWRIPFLDRIFVQSVRLRMISDSGQTMTTRDGRTLTLAVAVGFAISDIRRLYESVNNPDATLLHQVQGIVARLIAATDSSALTPAMIEADVQARMPSTEWGLSSVRVLVTTFAYVRVYRLLNYEYRQLSSSNDIESERSRATA
jgi:regulator of protease activity HflC (stomatin/prohibitin superfamily)